MLDGELINTIFLELKNQNLSIATAESCTGGLIGNTFTNVSGSSEYFKLGIIAYNNKSKVKLLDISEIMLKKYGAVSKEVAKSMADGVRKLLNVDIGISTTGIAGPTGGTKEKPIGLVYIAVSTRKVTIVKKFNFPGDRLENKDSTCNAALEMLLDVLIM